MGQTLRLGAAETQKTTGKALRIQRLGLEGGPEGFYLGYRSLLLIDMEGFPLGHVEASANVNEKDLVEPVLNDALGWDMEVEAVAGEAN